MSNEDISMVCNVLLGISNPDKDIRTTSVNKLQELSNNLGALTYCLIEIASKAATNNDEKRIKTTALVICRKIVDSKNVNDWQKIDKNLKEKIKISSLNLLNAETDPSQNNKVCDLIVKIMEKELDSEEQWPQLFSLALSLPNFDPNDNSKIIQIRTLLKLLKEGSGYIYQQISEQFKILIPYFEKLLDSNIDMKIKTLTTELINELISFCEKKEVKLFKECIKKIVDNIYKCYLMKEKMPEECVKVFLQELIGIGSIEPSLFTSIFPQIFTLCQNLIAKKDYDDEKIRELAFELIINLDEEKPTLFKSKKKDSKLLLPFLEMIFSYALEFEKTTDQSWAIPNGNNYDHSNEEATDEKVNLALSLIDRVLTCNGIEDVENELKSLIEKFLQQKWEYQYVAFYVLGTFSEFDKEISKIENIFKILFGATSKPEAKLRFSAIHCINKFCDNYNPSFQTQTIKEVIPLLENLLKTETVLRIQCEIISTIISFIQFTTSDALKPYVKELFELLFTLFKQNNLPIIIRKLVSEAILEIISTMEEEITPLAPVAFDLIIDYFIKSYKIKDNQILYGVLIECLTSLGIYVKEKYLPVVPEIVKCIVEIVKGFNSDKVEPIRADLTNSLERLLPILKENYKQLLPNLIETVLTLIKLRPQMAISSSPTEEFDMNKILKDDDEDDDKIKGKEIQTTETEDLASSLSLLNTIITSIGDDFLQYVDKVEIEIVDLITYKADSKVRTKSSKILPNLLLPMKQEQKTQKAKYYLTLLVSAIEKETINHVCEKLFVHLKEVIENAGQFLNVNELNELFDKIAGFFENLKIKRNKLLSNTKTKKPKHNDDDEDDENISDLLDEEIEELENVQSEISDNIGILLKTHKNISSGIVQKIINNIIPTYSKSSNMFEVKMGLYIADDLIEFIGQDMLGDANWTLMYNIISQLVTNKDVSIRQAAAYGIGNFAKFTTRNFDNYSKGLIDSLYNAMNIPKDEDDDDEKEDNEEYNSFGMSYDNMVSAIGKIINYQFNSKVVQEGLTELMNKWIMNLPIKYDDTEKEQQHEWLVDLFLRNRQLIGENCYSHYFETLVKIYEMNGTSEKVNNNIKNIFNNVKNEEKLKQIVDKIYQTSDDVIKKKLEKLIK
jgi:hypothetical protein